MDPDLKLKITNRLRIFLNRDPSEREIINGQNDSTLRAWIAEDDAHEQNALTEILAVKRYARDRAPSFKLLLEHLAAVL